MAEFLLIRHGFCDPVGKRISGRMPGIHLNERGIEQVEKVADGLGSVSIAEIYCSPLERTVETALRIARKKGLPVKMSEALNEIDYGLWTGLSFGVLESEPLWIQFNTHRGATRIPGGEMMIEVASRMSSFIEKLRRSGEGVFVAVSHGDPIKAVLAHYGGIPFDYMVRFEVETASVSSLMVDDYGVQIRYINKLMY